MSSQSGQPGTSIRRAGRRILFVLEDDPNARDLLVEVAGDAGWDVRGFASIPSIRRALAHAVPDLLLVDEDVADGHGGEFAREVQGDGRARGVPIIVLSEASPRRRAELATWAAVIAKPFDLADLERRLSAIDGKPENHQAQSTAS